MVGPQRLPNRALFLYYTNRKDKWDIVPFIFSAGVIFLYYAPPRPQRDLLTLAELQLEAFAASEREAELDLSPTLSRAERARVHQMCEARGLAHLSLGEGSSRHIRITKPQSGAEVRGAEAAARAGGSRRRGACLGGMGQLEGAGGDSDEVDEWAAEAARYSAQGGFQELGWVGEQRGGRQGRGMSAGRRRRAGRDNGVGSRRGSDDGEEGQEEGSGGEE
jgi:hypothetical protein